MSYLGPPGEFSSREIVPLLLMNRRAATGFLAVVLALSVGAGTALASPPSPPRPAAWATAVESPGVQNLYRVETDLFRSARPSGAGFRELAALGVKTASAQRTASGAQARERLPVGCMRLSSTRSPVGRL